MIDWFLQNKEWLFSGIGITALTIIVWIIRKIFENKKRKSRQNNVNITGEKSLYIEKNEGDINIK